MSAETVGTDATDRGQTGQTGQTRIPHVLGVLFCSRPVCHVRERNNDQRRLDLSNFSQLPSQDKFWCSQYQ